MTYRQLAVPGAWEVTPRQHGDTRGVFLEYFQSRPFLDSVGHQFDLRQANCSVSDAGVLRGIHYSDVPPGQAKYVTCAAGAVLDVVVDLRVGSPTFGAWDSVLLDDVDRRAIYLSEGLGHAFMSLQDGSTVLYLCSTAYSPDREHGVDPLDPEIGIDWPNVARNGTSITPRLSAKDRRAPGISEAARQGMLPNHDDVAALLRSLREASR